MWGRQRKQNRRQERAAVLEVKLRSAPARRGRWRLVTLALGLAVLALAGAYVGSTGWEWTRQRVLDSRWFALNTIEITTDGVWVTPEQIRRWAGIREGDNLLLVDMPRIRRDLELIPQIESAAVERVLPHLLRLRITEREPVAQLLALEPEGEEDLAPVLYYLDRFAVVMPPLPRERNDALAQELANLPVLRGIRPADIRLGQPVASRQVRAALEFLRHFEPSPLSGEMGCAAIDLSTPEVLQVRTTRGSEVILASQQLASQLDRWWLVHAAGRRLAKRVASLDLSITNNCPVMWVEEAGAPAAKPAPPKASRLRKKHV